MLSNKHCKLFATDERSGKDFYKMKYYANLKVCNSLRNTFEIRKDACRGEFTAHLVFKASSFRYMIFVLHRFVSVFSPFCLAETLSHVP